MTRRVSYWGNRSSCGISTGHTGPLGKGAKHRGVSEKAEEMTPMPSAPKHGGTAPSMAEGYFWISPAMGVFFSKWLMGDGESSVIAYGAELNTPLRQHRG